MNTKPRTRRVIAPKDEAKSVSDTKPLGEIKSVSEVKSVSDELNKTGEFQAVPSNGETVLETSRVEYEVSPNGVNKTTIFRSRQYNVVIPGSVTPGNTNGFLIDNPGITRADVMAARETMTKVEPTAEGLH
jgi:hypothetical protein